MKKVLMIALAGGAFALLTGCVSVIPGNSSWEVAQAKTDRRVAAVKATIARDEAKAKRVYAVEERKAIAAQAKAAKDKLELLDVELRQAEAELAMEKTNAEIERVKVAAASENDLLLAKTASQKTNMPFVIQAETQVAVAEAEASVAQAGIAAAKAGVETAKYNFDSHTYTDATKSHATNAAVNANFVAEFVAPIEQLGAVLLEGSSDTYSLTGTQYNPAKPPRQIVVEGIGLLIRSADGFYRPAGSAAVSLDRKKVEVLE